MNGRGVHKRPIFDSAAHAEWYEKTSKRVLYELLRDAEIQLTGCDDKSAWLPQAQFRKEALEWNKII